MKNYLNNVLKGLVVAFVIIVLGGALYLKINIHPTNALVLVSSNLVGSITTNSSLEEKQEESKLEEDLVENEIQVFEEEINDEKLEIKEEIKENIKEEVKEEFFEENIKTDEVSKEEVVETIAPPVIEEPIQEEEPVQEEIVIKGEYAPNLEVMNTIEVLATYHGKMTGYGPDCYGCSGITASGMNVLNGNIYYNDKTFGSIRIVAGDRSIPFGSIIKITGINISSEPVLAIVLDRGGMIGFAEGKHAYFDLLYASEGDASSFGRQDATFELLRSGY